MTSEKIHSIHRIETIESEKFSVSWLRGNVFEIKVREKAYLELDDVKEIQIHKAKLIKNQQHGVLFITPEFGNLSKEARLYAAVEEASLNCVAKAIIVPNLGMNIMAKFFITFNKPVVPHKIFTNPEDGFNWLTSKMSK